MPFRFPTAASSRRNAAPDARPRLRSRPRPRLQRGRRALAKAVTWQALGLVTSTLIAFALTGSLATGGTFAVLSACLGTVLFVVHERLWDTLAGD